MASPARRSTRLAFVALRDAVGLVHCDIRLEILAVVSLGPIDVSSLARRLELDDSHVSLYLGMLARAEYVVCVREGQRRRVFSLGPGASMTIKPEGGGVLALRADDGNIVQLILTQQTLDELRGAKPALVIKTAPAAADRPHPAGARSGPQPPNGRALG